MGIIDLEREIEAFILSSSNPSVMKLMKPDNDLLVIKYMPAEYVADVITNRHLYASERVGFTWGDAIYVTPVSYPRSTMMYGHVGVVGSYPTASKRFFNADQPRGVSLYQQWITNQTGPYRDLTTTVHANLANRLLRNSFRTRFQIDCVYFKPDEECSDYVDTVDDWWLAITHWDAYRIVGHGFSDAISNLKWCVVGPDAFRSEGRGYKAALHKGLTASHMFRYGHYSTLATDIQSAYASSSNQVVICDFD